MSQIIDIQSFFFNAPLKEATPGVAGVYFNSLKARQQSRLNTNDIFNVYNGCLFPSKNYFRNAASL